MNRLVVSSRSILENIIVGEGDEDKDIEFDVSKGERELLIPSSTQQKLEYIRSTIDEFRVRNNIDREDRDFRITLLATWEKKKDDDTKCQEGEEEERRLQSSNLHSSFQSVLYCHVGYLPQSSSNSTVSTTSSSTKQMKKHIQVLIHGHGRQNALAKDSKWVLDRKQLITPTTSNEYEEIILLNDNNELLEGTQTNFYVVTNTSTVITANESILFGSVRDSVLRVCDLHDINVELRSPTLDDLRHASGVFITSTSRLVMPVHEVVLGDLQSSSLDDTGGNQKKKDEDDLFQPRIAIQTVQLPRIYVSGYWRMWRHIVLLFIIDGVRFSHTQKEEFYDKNAA